MRRATRAREVAAAVVLMAIELRASFGGGTLQGEDNDDGVLQRACLPACLNGGGALGWFRGFSRSALRTCAAASGQRVAVWLGDRVAGAIS